MQSLERHINFAFKQEIRSSVSSFPCLLVDLVFARPTEFTEAFERFPDICAIASVAFESEFRRICESKNGEIQGNLKMTVLFNDSPREINVGIQLLTSIAVVLGVWRGEAENGSESIAYLCDSLLCPDSLSDAGPFGLASASSPGSKAVPVEPVRFIG